jgi:uncharacterized membrane protein required for colicin V production
MFAAIISKTSPWWQNFTFNWFDGLVVGLLMFGLWRGRHNGMSGEILPLGRWLAIALGAGFGHALVGEQLLRFGVTKMVFGNYFDSETAALVTAYLLIALAAILIFSTLKHYFQKKLTENNSVFGGGEYYLGMVAGVIRYASVLLVALALLNAPVYSAAEIQAQKTADNLTFGGGLKGYNGNFFPKIYEVQDCVFKESLTGPQIKAHLSWLLINTTPTAPSSGPKPATKTPVIHMGN